jgi:hypothetical protein
MVTTHSELVRGKSRNYVTGYHNSMRPVSVDLATAFDFDSHPSKPKTQFDIERSASAQHVPHPAAAVAQHAVKPPAQPKGRKRIFAELPPDQQEAMNALCGKPDAWIWAMRDGRKV